MRLKKDISIFKATGIRAYTLTTGIASLAVGSEVLYGVMGKLMNILPSALNLGVGMTRGVAATIASAGVALVVGAGISVAIDGIEKSFDKKKTNKKLENYNETQLGMNI